VVLISSFAAATTRLNGWLALSAGEPESVAVTVKLNEPDCVGVPEMVALVPEALCNLRPDGSAPLVTLHAIGGVPPLVWMVAL
jgi:hypothetical protein